MESTKLVKESISEANIFLMSSLINKNNASPYYSFFSIFPQKDCTYEKVGSASWTHPYCQREVVPGRGDKQGSVHYE